MQANCKCIVPLLSVIIPAFNEEGRLSDTLRKIAAFTETQSYCMEVIVVDNASTDSTSIIISHFVSAYPFIRSLYEPRHGKGAAIRKGILAAEGKYVLIYDADMAVPLEEVDSMLLPQINNYDIIIGSREAAGAKRHGEPLYRHIMGRIFNIVVQYMILPGVRDTQCGFKSFRRDVARDLFSASKLNGWGFDAEILYIAILRGYRIVEIPVSWHYGKNSKINLFRDSWNMFREVVEIHRNGRKGVYNNKRAHQT
jgi:dolichyl-phosphate beta-glucosyltransferase